MDQWTCVIWGPLEYGQHPSCVQPREWDPRAPEDVACACQCETCAAAGAHCRSGSAARRKKWTRSEWWAYITDTRNR